MNEHQSRFKAYLLPRQELAGEAPKLQPLLRSLQRLAPRLSPAENVLLFIFIFAETRNSGQWYIKRRGLAAEGGPAEFLFSELPPEFAFLKKLNANCLSEFCERYHFKKLPGSIPQTLWRWQRSEIRLQLKEQPVTPLEMLEAQAQGGRIVTLDMNSALRGVLVDGQRDSFEFLLHDLVHADLYFGDYHFEQREFFNRFLAIYKSNSLALAMERDPEFQKDIHYLVSDMNSHAQHLQAQLRASWTKHQLHCEGKAPSDALSTEGREVLEQRFTLINNLFL